MTPVLQVKMMGRFGNQLFQYAFSRAVCEQQGFELRCPRWIGNDIFDLGHEPSDSIDPSLPDVCESSAEVWNGNVSLKGYCQLSSCVSKYSKRDILRWFKIRPGIREVLEKEVPHSRTVAHRRVGDYFGYGYPVVSVQSYENAANRFGLGPIDWVTEENPTHSTLPDEMSFLADFWKLMNAQVILRGNSSFSWWAASLSNADVYAPIIDFLEGGREHDCKFVKGNWPRFSNLAFVQELKLKS